MSPSPPIERDSSPDVPDPVSQCGRQAAAGLRHRMVRLKVTVRVRPPLPGEATHVICDDRVGKQLAVRLPTVSFHQFGVVLG